MSLLDKAKVAAEKAASRAQQGVHQGQAKIEELQDKRKADALLRDLGSAYYDEERHGGDHEAVVRAVAAVDTHLAQESAATDDAAAHDEASGKPAADDGPAS